MHPHAVGGNGSDSFQNAFQGKQLFLEPQGVIVIRQALDDQFGLAFGNTVPARLTRATKAGRSAWSGSNDTDARSDERLTVADSTPSTPFLGCARRLRRSWRRSCR